MSLENFCSEQTRLRLLSHIDKDGPNGCWLWTSGRNTPGYGHLSRKDHKRGLRTMVQAHRLSYFFFVGPFDESLSVLHRCDVRHCVNPDHLFLGTPADNTKDCIAKGRFAYNASPKGEAAYYTVMTYARAEEVRNVFARLRLSRKALAQQFGCSVTTVNRVLRNAAWVRS